MARPGRPERNGAAQSFRQLRRFHHVINSDEVFGTQSARCDPGLPQKARIFDARLVCREELSPVFIAAWIPASDWSGVANSQRRNFKAAYFISILPAQRIS